MDYRSLGRQILFHRKKQNLTQEQLAELVGKSTALIGHVERGTRKASLETIVAISQCLHISMNDLLPPPYEPASGHALTSAQHQKARELLELALQMASP